MAKKNTKSRYWVDDNSILPEIVITPQGNYPILDEIGNPARTVGAIQDINPSAHIYERVNTQPFMDDYIEGETNTAANQRADALDAQVVPHMGDFVSAATKSLDVLMPSRWVGLLDKDYNGLSVGDRLTRLFDEHNKGLYINDNPAGLFSKRFHDEHPIWAMAGNMAFDIASTPFIWNGANKAYSTGKTAYNTGRNAVRNYNFAKALDADIANTNLAIKEPTGAKVIAYGRQVSKPATINWDNAVSLPIKITEENAATMTPKQWTAAQDYAIARGDWEEAQRLRDLHSKVAGDYIDFYHGTTNGLWTSIDPKLFKSATNSLFGSTNKKVGWSYKGEDFEPWTELTFDKETGWQLDSGEWSYKIEDFLKDGYNISPEQIADFNSGKTITITRDPNKARMKTKLFKFRVYPQNSIIINNPYPTNWRNIPVNGVIKTADNIAEESLKQGHDVTIIPNIIDMGPYTPESELYGPVQSYTGTDIIVNNPKRLKLQDAVTYNDNGVRIPLGERDNFNINDTRYGFIPWLLGAGTVGTAYGASQQGDNIKSYGGLLDMANKFKDGGSRNDYNTWKKKIKDYKDIIVDGDDTYDYYNFFKDNPQMAWDMLNDNPEAHFIDKYKTPNHPTYSNESIYSKTPYIQGGTWNDYSPTVMGQKWNYTLSPSQVSSNWDVERTINYLSEAENGGAYVTDSYGRYPTANGTVLGGTLTPVTITPNNHSQGGPLKSKFWNDLSMKEKSEMIRIAVDAGITDIGEIRNRYNEYAESFI